MADQRFSALAKDPRFRLPSRKEARTAVDARFQRLFHDQDFRKKSSVDRYGRKINPNAGTKELERLYQLDKAVHATKGKAEAAESILSEEESDDEEQVVEKRDPARQGGFSDSSSEEDDASEEESGEETELAFGTAGQEQTEEIAMGEVSRRIAAVNLDWDNIRATDIMAVASSFAPKGGRIESVTIYPSEFGQERMEQEELEGPPREIFTSSKRRLASQDDVEEANVYESDEDEDEDEDEKIKTQLQKDQADAGAEFDTAKLRAYQLERLRYFYAVIVCDDGSTAKVLYDAMDGREYLATANFFDLRFVPDSTSFAADRPHDTCTALPPDYTPNDFRTHALTHSRVQLTWDADDPMRQEVQKRAFSRAEADENDLQAYIGSDSSEGEEDGRASGENGNVLADSNAEKEDSRRRTMRAALGLGEKLAKSSSALRGQDDGPVGELQITFTSGLGGAKPSTDRGVFENERQDAESTRERYVRKERERKSKRKERRKERESAFGLGDGKSGAEDGLEASQEPVVVNDRTDVKVADGFRDPFFTDPAASTAAEKRARREAKEQKRKARTAQDAESEARRAELELLMAGDGEADGVRHFDMREVEKAEKAAKRKGKRKKEKKPSSHAEGDGDVAEPFRIETADPRFGALFEQHEFAIDPTHARFARTEGMKALVEEGRRKRKNRDGEEDEGRAERVSQETKKAKLGKTGMAGSANGEDIQGLVARLKGKDRRRRT